MSSPPLSAGLLMYRRTPSLEVLLVHPGGPFFRNRDSGVWSVPKGMVGDGETARDAARREFREETGLAAPQGELVELGDVRQKSGKRVRAWAFEGDCDPATLESERFELEWPPRSGRRQWFPEVDRAAFFDLPEARRRMVAGQTAFLDRLVESLSRPSPPRAPPR